MFFIFASKSRLLFQKEFSCSWIGQKASVNVTWLGCEVISELPVKFDLNLKLSLNVEFGFDVTGTMKEWMITNFCTASFISSMVHTSQNPILLYSSCFWHYKRPTFCDILLLLFIPVMVCTLQSPYLLFSWCMYILLCGILIFLKKLSCFFNKKFAYRRNNEFRGQKLE